MNYAHFVHTSLFFFIQRSSVHRSDCDLARKTVPVLVQLSIFATFKFFGLFPVFKVENDAKERRFWYHRLKSSSCD